MKPNGIPVGSKSIRFQLKKQESDCIYHFQTYLDPNGIPLGSKSIEKCYETIRFQLNKQESET